MISYLCYIIGTVFLVTSFHHLQMLSLIELYILFQRESQTTVMRQRRDCLTSLMPDVIETHPSIKTNHPHHLGLGVEEKMLGKEKVEVKEEKERGACPPSFE